MSTTITMVEKYYHYHNSWSTVMTVNSYHAIPSPILQIMVFITCNYWIRYSCVLLLPCMGGLFMTGQAKLLNYQHHVIKYGMPVILHLFIFLYYLLCVISYIPTRSKNQNNTLFITSAICAGLEPAVRPIRFWPDHLLLGTHSLLKGLAFATNCSSYIYILPWKKIFFSEFHLLCFIKNANHHRYVASKI